MGLREAVTSEHEAAAALVEQHRRPDGSIDAHALGDALAALHNPVAHRIAALEEWIRSERIHFKPSELSWGSTRSSYTLSMRSGRHHIEYVLDLSLYFSGKLDLNWVKALVIRRRIDGLEALAARLGEERFG